MTSIAKTPAYPRYARYKDSGVEWLGEIPKEWSLIPNKYLFVEKKETVGKKANEFTLLSLTLNGVIARDMENPQGKFPAEFDTYKKVAPKDLIFCLFDIEETPRTIGIAKQSGMITGAYSIFETNTNIDSNYLSYYYLSLDFDKKLKPLYTGLRNVIQKGAFLSIKSPVPSIEEQNRIVNFLDQKTAAIDTAIAKKQRLIELLKEQKAILINRAVTRGLNPDVPMKDSGVEWIGEIPAHWKVKKLKHLTNGIIDSEHKTAPCFDNGEFLIIRTSNVKDGELVLDKAQFTDCNIYQEWTKRAIPRAGDVVLTREAPAGEACVLEKDNFALLGQRMVLLRIDKSLINPYFLVSSIYQGSAKQFIETLSVGSTVAHFNMSDIKNMPVLVPDLKEQFEISSHIANLTEKVNNSVCLELSLIQKLQEYKQTLIAHAVTGKIKVS